MQRTALSFVIVVLLAVASHAQLAGPLTHARWSFGATKVSDCEYDVVLTANLDPGWHISSAQKNSDREVYPTEILFHLSPSVVLVGNLRESKPAAEYDATLGKTVLIHHGRVLFVQRIRLNSPGKVKVRGTYEYRACSNGVCLSPALDDFAIELQGAVACSK